jgi:hypothetical protein
MAAFRHLPDLFQNHIVAITGERELRSDSNKRRDDAYVELRHRRISKHRNMISQWHANKERRLGRPSPVIDGWEAVTP